MQDSAVHDDEFFGAAVLNSEDQALHADPTDLVSIPVVPVHGVYHWQPTLKE